jgi:hypothetical protein
LFKKATSFGNVVELGNVPLFDKLSLVRYGVSDERQVCFFLADRFKVESSKLD